MFRKRIQNRYNELSSNFRRLADFVLKNPLDVALMTATELAEQMDVDAATVVRFSQALGYSGFRELNKEVQRIVKKEQTSSYTVALDTQDDVELYRSLLENEKHNLALAQAQLTEQVDDLLPALSSAERIWIIGEAEGAHLAALCASMLRTVALPAFAIPPTPLETAESLHGLDSRDVVIGFSLTGMDLGTANVIELAREEGARTFIFSRTPVTAAAAAAETPIICPGPTQTQTVSFTGLAAMIVALVSAYTLRYPDRAAAAQEETQQHYQRLLEIQARNSSTVDIESLWRQI